MTKKEQQKIWWKNWYLRPGNRERHSARCLRWQRKTRAKSLKIRNLSQNLRRKNTPQARLSHSLRERIRAALDGRAKSAKTMELLGCSIEEFKHHLESQFLPGMSWENYGLWHIDHRIPCSSFDLTESIQQRQCFHFSNQQPLWKQDNLKKGSKRVYSIVEICNL